MFYSDSGSHGLHMATSEPRSPLDTRIQPSCPGRTAHFTDVFLTPTNIYWPCLGARPGAAARNAATGTPYSRIWGSMDELLPIRMLDEEVGPRELCLAPSLPFSFLSRSRTWQSRQDGEGQPREGGPPNSCSHSKPRVGYLMARAVGVGGGPGGSG